MNSTPSNSQDANVSNNNDNINNVISAVVATATHPDLPTILNDIGLVLNLVNKVHPSALTFLKSIL